MLLAFKGLILPSYIQKYYSLLVYMQAFEHQILNFLHAKQCSSLNLLTLAPFPVQLFEPFSSVIHADCSFHQIDQGFQPNVSIRQKAFKNRHFQHHLTT